LVIDTTSDAVTITFDSYFGTDCKECTDTQGCIWEIRCCPGYTIVDYVNDSPSYIGALYPGAFVKCSNDLCYEVIQAVNQLPTDNIVSVYGKCVDCSDDGGNQCR
jgi:hypothetical protein